ncbi:MAG: hypothetical protein ACON38_05865 [Akkermansiaceae bacterium]
MRNFVHTLGLVLAASGLSAGDVVTLKTGDVFTGEVVALSDGIITVKSPHSDSPLKVRNEKLQKLNFGETKTGEIPKNSQVINLRNNDSIPGEIVALTDTHASIQTWFAGRLDVPREQIDSIFFGVTPQTTIYRGPNDLSSWEGNDNEWELTSGRLSSRDRGTIGKDFDLPENFIFSTKFTWENSPNLRIHLCSNSVTKVGEAGTDSYLLYINSQGIQIKRVTPNPNDASRLLYKTLASYESRLRDISSQVIDLELRVDRSNRMIQLSINGDEVAPGFDPGTPPEGTHIVFESLSSSRRDAQIENIHIQKWDTKTQRFRSEPRASEEADTLTVDDGDRFSGKIISFDPEAEQQPFVVNSPQSEQPISVPLQNCSVMYFAESDALPESVGEYRLDLRTGGGLTISNIKLGSENLEATHPWLGKITLDRRIMSSISKGTAK